MLRIILPVLCLAVLTGCVREDPEKPMRSAATVVRQEKPLSLPLTIDSTFINSVRGKELLSYKDLRKMQADFAAIDEDESLEHFVDDFCFIDSLKRTDRYLAYVDSLDIGMTEDATAYRVGEVALSPQNKMLIWSLWVKSYEACPIFNGNFIIGTLRNRDSYTHIPLGKLYQMVDPPGSYRQLYTSQITDKWITINSETESDDDMDSPGEERETRCYTVQFREVLGDSSVNQYAGR